MTTLKRRQRVCTHCGHLWLKKTPRGPEPKRCPQCNSTRWDKVPHRGHRIEGHDVETLNRIVVAVAEAREREQNKKVKQDHQEKIKRNRKRFMSEYHQKRRRDKLGARLNREIDSVLELVRITVSLDNLFYNRAGIIGERWYRTHAYLIVSKQHSRIYIKMEYGRNRRAVPLGGRLKAGEYTEGGTRSIDVKSLKIKSHGRRYAGPAESQFLDSLAAMVVDNLKMGD